MKNSQGTLRRFPTFLWVVLFLCLALLFGFAYFQIRHAQTAPASTLDRYGATPNFQLTDQDGKEITLADLKGFIWVVDFVFTRCKGPCPILTARMAQLGDALKGDKNVKLVSVTVDPDYDTPEVLKEYANKFGADLQQWIFLTGPKDKIEAFMVKGMLQPVIRTPNAGLIHSTQLVLVDPEGQIRAFQDGSDPQVVAQVLTAIQSLRREAIKEGKLR